MAIATADLEGGHAVRFDEHTADADLAPLFRSLPDDRAELPCWGYVIARSRTRLVICALTARPLKPGAFEQFRREFMAHEPLDAPPPGYVRLHMVRNHEAPDEVICFGFFDGTVEDLRRTAAAHSYAEQLEAVAPWVDAVGADGIYDVIEEHVFR